MRIVQTAITLIVLALSPGLLWCQSTTATLVGTVTDTSGGVIAGAKVVVTNEGTGIGITASTNASGDYALPNLQAATYKVQVEFTGFRPATVTGVRLPLSSTVRVDIPLQTGAMEQSVTVTAAAPTVNSETASVGASVDSHAVVNLPLNGRMVDRFIQLTPGNTSDSASNPKLAGSMHWGGNFFTVDGVGYNDPGNGGGAYSYRTQLSNFPSIDTIQEFKIETNNAKAESEGSASVSMITKSGSNDFHGSVSAFNRNRFVAAKEFFATGQPKPQFNRNEFGFTLGGPVIKNKTFFFGSYEGLRQRTAATPFLAMGTAAMRSGNFAGLAAIKDPLAGGAPFPDNRIPTDRLDPRVQKLLAGYVPLPNQPGTGVAGIGSNYITSVGNVIDVNRYSVRVDHNINSMNSLNVVANHNIGSPYFVANGTPATYGNFADGGYITDMVALGYNRTFSYRTLNELRLSYFDHKSVRIGQNTDFDPTSLFPGLYSPLPIGGLSTMNITGFQGISDTGGSARGHNIVRELVDNFSFVRGSHTFKTGIDISYTRVVSNPGASAGQFGTFNFNGRYSGNSYADFLLGYPIDATRATVLLPWAASYSRYGAYFQDDWKVSRKLTLNLGVRYMLQSIIKERDGSMANVDLATGQLVVRTVDGQLPKMALPRALAAYPYVTSEKYGWGSDMMNGDHNNFAPRFGFAYRPFADSRTVIRGGYGFFYNVIPLFIGPARLINGNPLFVLNEFFESSATSPTLTLENPFPGSGRISANPNTTAVNTNMRNALCQQWNFTVERELPAHFGLRVSYVGNKATRTLWYNVERNNPLTQVPGTLQANRPFQPWASVATMDSHGNAFTNQMQVEVTKRYDRGLYLQTSFTWNKTIDDTPISGGVQNPYRMDLERANGDQIRQKVFYGALTYDLPFGPGRTWLAAGGIRGKLIGGWGVGSILQLRTGQPFSVTFSPTQAGWYASRATTVGSNVYPDQRGLTQWFNPAAFAFPAPFTFGTSARNMLFGPGQKAIDFSVLKNTEITERFKLQFRAEAFNLPNHPSFGNPAANISTTSTVGRITSTTVASRTVQFGLKLLF